MWFLGSHGSHGSHGISFDGEKSHGSSTDCGFLGSHRSHGFHRFSFDGEKSHGGWGCGVWGCCLITPSALSAPIYQSSHRFNEIQQKDYLWEFVLICGRKNTLIIF